MANTYTQVYIQLVFGVKHRACLLHKSWRESLFKYMTGIIQKQNHLLIAINGVEDHVHILIAMRPHQALSDLVRHVKSCSSRWINDQGFLKYPFHWQNGFGAFSYGQDSVPTVIKYVQNQETHHANKTFDKEYKKMLKDYGIDYDDRYLFNLDV